MQHELTIGELAARSGVATSALRFYEREGLIEARRTDGNQRRYPAVTLRRVALVQAGKAAPWFDQPGGGMQYKTGERVQMLVERGYLRQIWWWE